MATRGHEAFPSGELTTSLEPKQSRGQLIFHVKDAATAAAAEAYALVYLVPPTYHGLRFRTINTVQVAPTGYVCRADYDGAEEDLEVGEWRISFEDSGETTKMLVGLEERKYPATAPDQFCAINVQDGKPQGLDVEVGGFVMVITYRQPGAIITPDYAYTCAALRGKTNNAEFYTFLEGELKFLGMRGQQGSQTDPEIEYRFQAGRHVIGADFGDITGVRKDAHEVMWPKFRDTEDTNEIIQKPVAIYVTKVHEADDFSKLGIGTGA